MILAIDVTNWIHSQWYALKGRGVLASVKHRVQVLTEYVQPSRVLICFDRRSFRHDIFPAYKANRKEKDPALLRDLDEATAALAEVGIVVAEDGFEADDCLATAARVGCERDETVVLASPDKDMLQCVRGGEVIVLRGFTLDRGILKSPDWYSADRLKKEYGLLPEQMVDYQALCGDPTDGIPGCAGWGPKTTLAAMQKAGSLKAILADPWALAITAKQQAALTKFKVVAEVMVKLVQLRDDVAAVRETIK